MRSLSAFLAVACITIVPSFCSAQTSKSPLAQYISISDPVVALTHVEVIDGTGAAPVLHQTIVLDHGKIASFGPSNSAQIPAGAKVLDLHGHTVYPGLVGMHEHLFYVEPGSAQYGLVGGEMFQTGAPLYLAAGVTTARTTGSIEPYADL
ncbi:MAG TPA: amidohydrolase, partial [Acidobacteriaceae bacterium]|nr:amidohydrolase [Acidobacteriaceae bacterium]